MAETVKNETQEEKIRRIMHAEYDDDKDDEDSYDSYDPDEQMTTGSTSGARRATIGNVL